jgi:hypothetical protein
MQEFEMDDYTATGSAERATDESGSCTKPFSIRELLESRKDKLGHDVEEILWLGRNYAIYRSHKGVYVQFADCRQEEIAQRSRFTEISPELCELRYLTHEMHSRSGFVFGPRNGRHLSSLYDHNIAQALMLVMEDQSKVEKGKQLAQQTLKMAVERVTNDNTVLYFIGCLSCWIASITGGLIFAMIARLAGEHAAHSQEVGAFVVAAMSGATGALLSVATRLQAFQLKPCQQSSMNYLMSCTRVGIGLIAGPILLLLSSTVLSEPMRTMFSTMGEWREAAVLGLIGGFAERLIPNLLRQTIGQIDSTAGTPVQALSEMGRHGRNAATAS